MVFRSRDTVERVLKRFLHGGLPAIPRRTVPGRVPTVTPEWKAELLRVIDLDPHTVGIRCAHWTTGLLATSLAAKTQIPVTAATMRLYLRAADDVCKRPPLDAQTQRRGPARLRGKRLRVAVILAGAGTPPPPPVTALVAADFLAEVPPAGAELGSLLPHADVDLQEEVPCACHPTLTRVWCRKGRRGQHLVEAPRANDKGYGCGLVDWCDDWCEGRLAPGRTADGFWAQGRVAVARSRARGQIAIVMVDNLRTQPPAGSRLVRQRLAELPAHLRIVYTPAYAPDANRIAWLWRWSRRDVTHKHQRATVAALLEDISMHFQTLAPHAALVLRPIGRPLADQVSEDQARTCAA